MKTLTAILLALVLFLTACGSEAVPEETNPTPEPKEVSVEEDAEPEPEPEPKASDVVDPVDLEGTWSYETKLFGLEKEAFIADGEIEVWDIYEDEDISSRSLAWAGSAPETLAVGESFVSAGDVPRLRDEFLLDDNTDSKEFSYNEHGELVYQENWGDDTVLTHRLTKTAS
jgi:hypothetical protein